MSQKQEILLLMELILIQRQIIMEHQIKHIQLQMRLIVVIQQQRILPIVHHNLILPKIQQQITIAVAVKILLIVPLITIQTMKL